MSAYEEKEQKNPLSMSLYKKELGRLINSKSLSSEEKEAKIEDYGILAYPYLNQITSKKSSKSYKIVMKDKEKAWCKDKVEECSRKELNILSDYVESEMFD